MVTRGKRARRLALGLLCLVIPLAQAQRAKPKAGDLLDAVNVFTGTSNSRWMLFPGATTPLGMVKFSPDNQGNVWNGGYEYTVASISGFSLLHTLGLNSFSIMPFLGSIENEPGQFKLFPGGSDGPFGTMWTAGYRSRIDKKTETGHAGYYAVTLVDAGTRVELTSTDRTGWMRLTPSGTSSTTSSTTSSSTSSSKGQTHIVLDFGLPAEESGPTTQVHVVQNSARELTGSVTQENHYAGQFTVYFDLQFSRDTGPMNSFETGEYKGGETNYGTEWRRPRTIRQGVRQFDATGPGGVWVDLTRGRGMPPVVARVGVSLVSVEGAKANLQRESAPYGFRFDEVAAAAAKTWRKVLSRIEVEGGSPDDRSKLYTNLYRAYTGKALLEDVDGAYRDACGVVQQLPAAPRGHMYSSDALWVRSGTWVRCGP